MTGIQDRLQAATQLHQSGALQKAERAYREILREDRGNADALHLLGVISQQRKDHAGAVKKIRRAIKINPGVAMYHYNLGLALKDLNKLDQASDCFRRAITVQPDYAEAHYTLGTTLQFQGHHEKAAACHRTAIGIQPEFANAHLNLGIALKQMRQFDQALASYRRALRIQPDLVEAYVNTGNVLKERGQFESALESYRKAVQLRADLPQVHFNIGLSLAEMGRWGEAKAAYLRALELDAGLSDAHAEITVALTQQGRLGEALEYRKRMAKKGLMDEADPFLLWLYYSPGIGQKEQLEQATAWTANYGAGARTGPKFANNPEPGRKLNIGYVSPDFRRHSVGYFIEAILQNHDASSVEVFCYANSWREDTTTERLKAAADHWRTIVDLPDETAKQTIIADGIDILVDLSGHTTDNRLQLFALKPAPVQVTYLGYPGTTGLAAIDYRVTDPLADPEGDSDPFYTEELVRLKDGFLCFTAPRDAPEVSELPGAGSGRVTFGSFNNLAKITPRVIEVWAEILKRTPESRFLLKHRSLADLETREYFSAEFGKNGVGPDRLTLMDRVPLRSGHLGIYDQVDIALDPFPYNGTATTCEALWMGVPVVALKGERHSGRVGQSLLARVGLDELVARAEPEYVDIAVALAVDEKRLKGLRAGMRQDMLSSPLMDGPGFTRSLEDAYRGMWRTWCARQGKS